MSRCVKHIPGCPGKAGGDHVTIREDLILKAVKHIHGNAHKPTSRSVLAWITGKSATAFPQGMGGQDVIYFRRAMLEVGYVQAKTGRWTWPEIPELDEVECDEPACLYPRAPHVISEHKIGWNWITTP